MKAELPKALEPWIYDRGSFMKRAHGHHLEPQIQVLRQAWQYPTEEERQVLGLASRRYLFCREVLIKHKNTPLLYAQALIPTVTLKGQGRQLLYLGQRALGSFLFAQKDLERTPFELRQFHLPIYASAPLWGRRSAFYFQEKALLLSEVFLPGLIQQR